jgi:DNA-binding NarL/FixJ family response regulator
MPKTARFDNKIRVAVIQHHPIEREYLAAAVGSIPGVTVSAAYSDMAEALGDMRENAPALALVDMDALAGPGENGLRELHRQCPHTGVVILSAGTSQEELICFLEEGVSAWLDKPCPTDQIMRAILLVHEGGTVLSSNAARTILGYFRARGISVHALSRREKEVLDQVAQGLQGEEIAKKLELCKGTVRTHIHRILHKLKVKSQTEALAKYFNPGAAAHASTAGSLMGRPPPEGSSSGSAADLPPAGSPLTASSQSAQRQG